MSNPEDLRGSTPVLTAKDVLLEVRQDVKDLKSSVDVLVSQDLDGRLGRVEEWKATWTGKALGIGVAAGAVSTIIGYLLAVNALAQS